MLNKKRRKTIVIGISIFVILIGFLAFAGFNNSLSIADVPLDTQIGQCSGGLTSFSVDKITINSDKSRVRVYGVAKGSECLNIKLTASQLDSVLNSQGVDATKDIIGEIKLLEYTKTFPIDKTGKNYYNLMNNVVLSGTSLWLANLQSCKDKGYNAIYVYREIPLGNLRCVLPGVNGVEGSFSSARSYENFKVQFTINGESTILSREQQSVNIGNNHVEWTGNLMNLDEVSVPQYDARLIGSKWELVEDGIYSLLDSRLIMFLNCMDSKKLAGFVFDSSYDSCKSQFDTMINPLFTNKLSQYKSDNSNLIYDADTDSNALYVSLKATPYPSFILDLDAEEVGIIALEGKPDITSCVTSQNDLKSGTNKIATFSVKNDANTNNVEFYASITCNQGVTAFIPNFYMNSMQTKTITTELIPVNPNQNDLPFTCNLNVQDLKSGNSDSCSFTGKVAYVSGITCEPNSLSCDQDLENVLKCSYDGKNKELYKECQYGCEYTLGSAKCREQNDTENLIKCESCDSFAKSTIFSWIFPSTKCQKTFLQGTLTCALSFVKLALIPIILIFASLFGFGLFNDILSNSVRNEKTRKIIALILSLLVGTILAILTYFLFAVGVIVSIIYIIIRVVIKFFIK